MATERAVSRNQKAEYVDGSRAKGYYVFSIQGLERTNRITTQNFDLPGARCVTQDEAKQSAWAAARAWVAEIGEVTKTDSEYKSIN